MCPILRQIESHVQAAGIPAVGFLSYEASPAFDEALICHDPGDFPLLWFALFEKQEYWTDLPDPENPIHEKIAWRADLSRKDYRQAVQSIKSDLASGKTYQVNFTYRLNACFHLDPYALFHQLHLNQKSDFSAFIQTDRFSLCSGSPELFFELKGKVLRTRPMKGTCSRGRTRDEDDRLAERLCRSPKAQAENVMIVDLIRNDLGRIAKTGSVRVADLYKLEKYPNVWQMTSEVEAMTDASVTEIFQALFPCASVTGAPKAQTMQIIRQLESAPRNGYTGAVGWIAPNRSSRFSVAIRTACVDRKSGTAEFGTGGGVVWDSVADHEFLETLDKASILKKPQPEFQLVETCLWTPEEGYFLLDDHLKRMRDSACFFDFQCVERQIRKTLDGAAEHFPEQPQRVRLLLSRKGSVRVENAALSANPDTPIRLGLALFPVDVRDVFLYHKTTRRKVYEEARAACPDCDDVILWNQKNELTETTIANLVIQRDGQYWTPPVSSGLLNGTYRSCLLKQGIIKEKRLFRNDLNPCQTLYCINSVRRWIKAVLVDQIRER